MTFAYTLEQSGINEMHFQGNWSTKSSTTYIMIHALYERAAELVAHGPPEHGIIYSTTFVSTSQLGIPQHSLGFWKLAVVFPLWPGCWLFLETITRAWWTIWMRSGKVQVYPLTYKSGTSVREYTEPWNYEVYANGIKRVNNASFPWALVQYVHIYRHGCLDCSSLPNHSSYDRPVAMCGV